MPILSFLVCLLVCIITVPFLVLCISVRLLAALLELPRFIHRWLVHPSDVLEKEYHPPKAYALITGATSGIGRALAKELADRGWNLILHGRNPIKLDSLAEHINRTHPGLDTRLIVQDARQSTCFSQLFAHNLHNLLGPITLLIHTASAPPPSSPFPLLTSEEITSSLNTNTTFPTLLTHHLLSVPRGRYADERTPLVLKTSTQPQLRCVINVSCISSLHSPTHAATKAYTNRFSQCLALDVPAGVEVLNLLVGHTRTPLWSGVGESVMVQEMDECVKNMLSAVGLGRVRGGWMWWCCDLLNLGMAEGVYVYWVHEVVAGAQRLFPGRVSGLLVRYYDGLLLGDSSV